VLWFVVRSGGAGSGGNARSDAGDAIVGASRCLLLLLLSASWVSRVPAMLTKPAALSGLLLLLLLLVTASALAVWEMLSMLAASLLSAVSVLFLSKCEAGGVSDVGGDRLGGVEVEGVRETLKGAMMLGRVGRKNGGGVVV